MDGRTGVVSDRPCSACGSTDRTAVLLLPGIPVENSRLETTAERATAVVRGDMQLVRCDHCGMAENDAFDPKLVVYDAGYEDSQAHSPYFQAFAHRIIDELLDRYALRGRRALEVGCGRGDFLHMYCERSGGTGVGIDPSATREAGVDGNVEILAEWYKSGSGDHHADVVICRHTLEHIHEPARFLRELRTEFDARPDTVLYLEVPDTARIAHEGAFWDVYYEHCVYFDADALTGLLWRTGWEPLECRLDYGGQYLVAHARPTAPFPFERGSPVLDFGQMTDSLTRWRIWATECAGRRSAVWAASSKAVGFLAAIPQFEPLVAVDINPAKRGRFLPGSGLAVCAPEDLREHDVELVLVMNPLYIEEIRTKLDGLAMWPGLTPLA